MGVVDCFVWRQLWDLQLYTWCHDGMRLSEYISWKWAGNFECEWKKSKYPQKIVVIVLLFSNIYLPLLSWAECTFLIHWCWTSSCDFFWPMEYEPMWYMLYMSRSFKCDCLLFLTSAMNMYLLRRGSTFIWSHRSKGQAELSGLAASPFIPRCRQTCEWEINVCSCKSGDFGLFTVHDADMILCLRFLLQFCSKEKKHIQILICVFKKRLF